MRSSRTVIALLILVGVIALLALSVAERDVAHALAAFIGLLLALAILDPRLVDETERSGVADEYGANVNPATLLPMLGRSGVDVGGSPLGMDIHQAERRNDL